MKPMMSESCMETLSQEPVIDTQPARIASMIVTRSILKVTLCSRSIFIRANKSRMITQAVAEDEDKIVLITVRSGMFVDLFWTIDPLLPALKSSQEVKSIRQPLTMQTVEFGMKPSRMLRSYCAR